MKAAPEYETIPRACAKCGATVDHTEKRAPDGTLLGTSVTWHPCRENMRAADEEDADGGIA